MADNYFNNTISSLDVGTDYYFKFRWKYADGTFSDWSVVKYAKTAGTKLVEKPTLPTGLSVAAASFGVTASWEGTYASSTFLGFKSVNIYASTSDLGSTTTTDLTSKLVGSMTVDRLSNKITIGSTLLKNVLGLTSTSVYTTPMYFYYISVNANNEFYKVGGVATYTRISSSGISPTQASKIDLENNTISIENLVAGNGNFTEYLRVGATGESGARITLASNTTAVSNAGVQPGLRVYDSGGNAVISAPFSGDVTISGAVIKSSNSNKSIKLDPSTNAISFYNVDNVGVAHLAPMGSSGSSYQGIVINTGGSPLDVTQTGLTSGFPLIALKRSSTSDTNGAIAIRPGGSQFGGGIDITADQYNGIWYTKIDVGDTRVDNDVDLYNSVRPIVALSSSAVGSSSPTTTTMNNSWSSSTEGLIALVYT